MTTLRAAQWALLAVGLLLMEAGCVSGRDEVALPADGTLLQPGAEPPAAVATSQSAPLTAEELDQLVAPIALYPDPLVAQILAAATYPTEVVEADRWKGENPQLQGAPLAQSIDQQSWDPSVKAVAQFPVVLAMLDKNLSWTSALGDAYAQEPEQVMDAVQVMRRRAQQAGNLQSTAQETITTDGADIAIEPANPELVYVPEYDPWLVYGGPLALYPDWVDVPGVFYDGPGVYFGLGIGIGVFGGFGWGWHHWEPDWRHHHVSYDHHRYVSHSPSFAHHAGRGDASGRSLRGPTSLRRPGSAGGRSFAPASARFHSGAFGGFDHGGVVGGYSARGRSSLGGGFHGGGFGGGGFHGGGFHGGGSHR